ncbi:MAG: Gfo/Idh/MocA family oxidoreductase [Bryobacterales bacterium]|nr:Gfo/Idh/MocA family oxidoreductase [Bryobacterales bacterium]
MTLNRRQFAAAAIAPLFVPSRAKGANDRLAYGLIGSGNRGGGLNRSFQKIGAQCAALCDVYKPYLEKAKSQSPAGVKTYTDYQELLAQPGLDFIVIATPDHQHAPMLYKALAAKKDVYLEKPLSLSPAQSLEMVDAVRKTKQIVQIGMQRRSMSFIRDARKLIADGAIGKISLVKAAWNWHFNMPLSAAPLEGELDWQRFLGNAPQRPLDPVRFRWWRGFWDYSGGNMTDQGTHLMDVVQWMTNSGAPISATCQGRIVNAPGVEVPNVFDAAFEYPDLLATWTLNYRTTSDFDWSIRFFGEDVMLQLDRHGLRMYRDPGGVDAPWTQKVTADLIRESQEQDKPEAHQQNMLDCVRSRQEPNCPIEVAAQAVLGPHMANIAYRESRKVRRDASGAIS